MASSAREFQKILDGLNKKKKDFQKGCSWCSSCTVGGAGPSYIGDGIRRRRRRSRRRRRLRRRRCGWPSSSPPTCRCRCTTSRRTPRTRSRPASSTRSLAAWRSRGCGRRRARPPARGARRRATRPRSRTGAGSACASSFSPRVSTWSVAVAVGTRQTAGTTPLTHRYYEL